MPEPDPLGIAKMTVAQLKEELNHRCLPISGLEAVLRSRLEEYLQSEYSLDDNAHTKNDTTSETDATDADPGEDRGVQYNP